jgi:hypothetical protein
MVSFLLLRSMSLKKHERGIDMEREYIEMLTSAITEYFGQYEFDELCGRFCLTIEYLGKHPNRKKLATKLITKNRGNHRRFLEMIVPKLMQRCEKRILNNTWEVNIFDEQMLPQLKSLQNFLVKKKKSDNRTKSVNLKFTAKDQLDQFMSKCKTVLTIVDMQIGETTFDCLKKIQTPIRLLTRQTHQDVAANIEGYIDEFRKNGHKIETRRLLRLNDRFIVFNGRCWMANRSLVDVGKTTLSLIECVDTQSLIVKEIGRRWREAKEYSS